MARRSVSSGKRDYRSNSHTKGSYKRKENIRDQKLVIIIACEGEKTEHFYFHAFFRALQEDGTISNASCIIAPHNHTEVFPRQMKIQDQQFLSFWKSY